MPKVLRRIEFGNPILREKARELSRAEVLSGDIQKLIADMRYTLIEKKYGIGLAAPQVGHNVALSVIYIRPTKSRPNLPKEKWANLVIINPKITKTFGSKKQLWEGCISLPEVFAKVPRYKKIELQYLDEEGINQIKIFEGLLAHVIQHEIDHLKGVLFVDKVKDPGSFMSGAEYRKRVVPVVAPE